MKNINLLTVAFALIFTLSSCSSLTAANENVSSEASVISHNHSPLWYEASPETSALDFYIYDGNTIQSCLLFNDTQIYEILETLSSSSTVPLENWSAENITFPIYGISISKKNGFPLQAVWTNEMLILNDGTAYEFDLDCSEWLQKYSFEAPVELKNTAHLPCADYLLKTDSGWNFEIMTEAEQLASDENIILEITAVNNSCFTAKFINNSSAEWTFGTSYEIQAENNGKWYHLPTKSDTNYAFPSIAMLVSPNSQSTEQTYSTEMYGNLPDGHYRLVVENLTAEFDISDNTIIYQ